MIFTSIPASRSMQTSDVFKGHRNGTDVPVPVGESRIVVVSTSFSQKVVTFLAYMWAFVASFVLDAAVPIKGPSNATYYAYTSFFPQPPLAITFQSITEDIRLKINDLGFSAQVQARYKYFRGPSSETVVPTLIGFGAQSDAYSPYGVANIRGFAAYGIITRLVNAALGFMSHITDENAPTLGEEANAEGLWERYAITKATDIITRGILFPYFDGLVLPDKVIVPSFIIETFGNCLGATPAEIKKNTTILQSGWASLSTCLAGLQISHLVFGMSLAKNGRLNIRPVIIGNNYRGFLLSGKGFAVMKGTTFHATSSVEELREEFETLDEHAATIIKLAELLSTIVSLSMKALVTVTPSQLSGPRKIHYMLRDRAFDAATHQTVSGYLAKLHFTENLWNVSDKGHIATALTCMVDKVLLPESAPFFLAPQFAFTKDTSLSTLAAFGMKSFSLMGPGANTTVGISRSGKMFENVPNVKLEGIPIFVKPISAAADDFNTMLKTGNITFRAGPRDKKGFSKIGSVGTFIGFDLPQYATVVTQLVKTLQSKKRGIEESGGPSEESSAKRAKRDERRGDDILDLFGGPVVVAPETGDHVMDDTADFFS